MKFLNYFVVLYLRFFNSFEGFPTKTHVEDLENKLIAQEVVISTTQNTVKTFK